MGYLYGGNWVRHSGLMVSVLDSSFDRSHLNPCWVHHVVFLDKALYSDSASLQPGIENECCG